MTDFKPRPTVYNGIQMRSRLEAGFALWLDEWGYQWEYEPNAFAMPSGGQYLPDFLVSGLHDGFTGEKVPTYIEVKHAEWFTKDVGEDRVALMEDCAELILENVPEAIVLTAQPKPAPFSRWMMGRSETGRRISYVRTVHLVTAYPHGVVVAEDHAYDPWPDGYWKVGE